LKADKDQVMPPYGVYAGIVSTDRGTSHAVANWGIRPTFGGRDPVLEIHALQPIGTNHYGQRVRFDCLHFLRAERQFSSSDALVEQIRMDIEVAQRLLSAREDP